jgi:hypothetical protein
LACDSITADLARRKVPVRFAMLLPSTALRILQVDRCRAFLMQVM